MSANSVCYPVRVDAYPEPSASRGLWLVKWLLLIPHFILLALLWLAFVLFSIAAFFAILATGRYPRALFDFNVGVLRWSWRVQFYGYAALGTDKYPPFTLADVPDYPAHLEVPYPERLSRGLVLVKWWLLALPHYIVVGVFAGGGIWFAGSHRTGDAVWDTSWGVGGLIGLLALIAAVVLLFTGRYPRSIYDLVLGMNRWVLRVAAYAGLMTDTYPPFRLDMGGTDPGSMAVPTGAPPPTGGPVLVPEPAQSQPTVWSGGRIFSAVLGSVLLFFSTGIMVAGGGLLWADRTQREGGYISAPPATVSTDRYALVTDNFQLQRAGVGPFVDGMVGTARLSGTPREGGADLFLGIGPTAEVREYLRGVGHSELTRFGVGWDGGLTGSWAAVDHHGGAPEVPPGQAQVWVTSASGPGTPTLTWRPTTGDWTAVIMRADGAPGVAGRVQVGATLPGLGWIGAGLLGAGVLLLAVGGMLVVVAAQRASEPGPGRRPARGGPGPADPQGPAATPAAADHAGS